MPMFLVGFLISLGRGLLLAVRELRVQKPQPICAECSFAHVQHAVGGAKRIFCTFNGGVRPVEINVMYCTDFRDRSVPARSTVIVGFINPARGIETALPEMARSDQ